MSVETLKNAKTYAEFVAAARAIVAASNDVTYHADKIASSVETAKSFKPGSWFWQDEFAKQTLGEAFFRTVLNAGLNGGYFHAVNGEVKQWEKNGSGSQALAEWLKNLETTHELPGIHLKTRDAAALVLAPAVKGLPYEDQRFVFLTDCADAGFLHTLEDILEDALEGDDIRFELRHAAAIAALSPAGFGGDPFLKKAILALQLTASHIAARGEKVVCDLPIPSDYQIPRVLTWLGVISLSEGFTAKLRSGALQNVESDEVTAFRAAAIIACADIAAAAGVEDRIVDELLFTVHRPNPHFKREALPAMRVASMWF